ncbi:hypothetical protein TRAPUB_9052 [Trametes pubescens]|uniref:Uncharacterized protein n=1 Tax=Trametes pubescens TaxID=154538 RepID=A0A1M2W3I7_TRAPU|nr:hypothetical protein TRAPUB_9052 [Trametes pubescens]
MEKGPVKFSSLAALLRLSHKYEVHHVQQAALRRLRPAFPDTFEAWKTYESSTLDFGPLNVRGAAMASRQVSMEPGEPIEAVNLLRRCGYDAMLLIALHMCTTLDMHTLLHGTARADGTREALAMDDLERCLVARETLQGRNAEFNRRMLDFESSGSGRPACATPAYCGRRAGKARTVAVNTLRDEDGCESEIGRRMFFVGLLSKAPELVKVCDTCVKHVLSSERQFVQELWNDLPAIMGLEVSPWPPNSEAASS